jgi:hypothetical protein
MLARKTNNMSIVTAVPPHRPETFKVLPKGLEAGAAPPVLLVAVPVAAPVAVPVAVAPLPDPVFGAVVFGDPYVLACLSKLRQAVGNGITFCATCVAPESLN